MMIHGRVIGIQSLVRTNHQYLDWGQFLEQLMDSPLSDPQDSAEHATVIELAYCYHTVITEILDDLVEPMVESTVPIQPHRPYYNQECRWARQKTRRLEQVFRRWEKSGIGSVNAVYQAW